MSTIEPIPAECAELVAAIRVNTPRPKVYPRFRKGRLRWSKKNEPHSMLPYLFPKAVKKLAAWWSRQTDPKAMNLIWPVEKE